MTRKRLGHINSAEEFDCLVDRYVESSTDGLTMDALSLSMGFRSTASLHRDYPQRRPEFAQSVARARLMVRNPELARSLVGPCRCDDETHLMDCLRREKPPETAGDYLWRRRAERVPATTILI